MSHPSLAIEAARSLRNVYRQATSRFRLLPNFIIIGAMKSGTSSLFNYMAQHPQIRRSVKKEVHFFDDNFLRGEQWYRAHFPYAGHVPSDALVGEASPLYLFDPQVADRIKVVVPDVKLIAILRNPTERAISHYFHEVRRKRENRPIEQAFAEEEATIGKLIEKRDFQNPEFIHLSYKTRGLYQEQLERYWLRFPKTKLLVLCSELFFQDPQSTLRRVFEFLEIDEHFEVSDLVPRGVGSNRTKVDSAVYETLDDYFAPHNRALFESLGEQFAW